MAWGLGQRQLGGKGLMCGKELEEERNKKMKGRIEGLGSVKKKEEM